MYNPVVVQILYVCVCVCVCVRCVCACEVCVCVRGVCEGCVCEEQRLQQSQSLVSRRKSRDMLSWLSEVAV